MTIMPPRVGILTDSVADLPRAYVEQFDVQVVPAYVVIEGETHRDDGTLDRAWFYDRLEHVKQAPTTAAPAPHEFVKAFQACVDRGYEEIIALLAASRVSSLYAHAVAAAQEFNGARIHVIDSEQVSMGMGWMVVTMGELLAQGVPVPEVIARVVAMRARTHILGVLDSLDYLRRSGRVGWAAGQMASLLRIKPLIGFSRGEAQLLGRVRTYWRAVQSILDRAREMRPLERLAILHSYRDLGVVEAFQQELEVLAPGLSIPVVNIGSVFATHVGPDCLGMALVTAKR